ncbi:MAG: lipoprotein-releasing ABC transporter permease subunit [Pseudomonadota bacterium]|nr:lipoprotein-releasing ABC transporter permease subunit [Pseudomonadota bacterium]
MSLSGRYEWLIGTRYLRSGQRRGFLSFITLISVLGLMLGVAVLLVVMSVMNGFEKELRARILSVSAHATLEGNEERMPDWKLARELALKTPGVVSAVPYIEAEGMFQAGERLAGAKVRGIDPALEAEAGGIAKVVVEGSVHELVPRGWRIILGEKLAAELGVTVGDTVVLVVAEGTVTPAGFEVRRRRFTVTGLLRSGMYEYDRLLALVHVEDAARLLKFGDAMRGVRLTVEDPADAPRLVRQVGDSLSVARGGGLYYVQDWRQILPNFFRSIQLTKSLLFMILSMIVAIAAFNVVATLVMVVKDKEADIAILRTFGAAPGNIQRIFSVQGAWIGICGVTAGILLGTLLAINLESLVHLLERTTGMQFMDAKVYLISDLPADVQLGDVMQVGLVALLLCLAATIYPAWRAARVLPAEALRHD